MNIDSEAQKDLGLKDEDAENVVGGVKKKKAKHAVAHNAAAPSFAPAAPSSPPITGPVTPGQGPEAEGESYFSQEAGGTSST